MMYTTPEKVRVRAGFQNPYNRVPILGTPDGAETTFYIDNEDPIKFVPAQGLSAMVAGISSIKVYVGLSGVLGSSQMVVTAIDDELGSFTLGTAPVVGASVTITYSSSSISNEDVDDILSQAQNLINNKLGQCYDIPLSPVPSVIERLTTDLAAFYLLEREYGAAAPDSNSDAQALYDRLFGDNSVVVRPGTTTDTEVINNGELGMICTPKYVLYQNDGTLIGRKDDDISGNNTFITGGRVNGRLFDITEEPFRKKDWQIDVNQNQPGSGIPYGDNDDNNS